MRATRLQEANVGQGRAEAARYPSKRDVQRGVNSTNRQKCKKSIGADRSNTFHLPVTRPSVYLRFRTIASVPRPNAAARCSLRARRLIALGLSKRIVQGRISPVTIMVAICRHLDDAIASHDFRFVRRDNCHLLSNPGEHGLTSTITADRRLRVGQGAGPHFPPLNIPLDRRSPNRGAGHPTRHCGCLESGLLPPAPEARMQDG